MAMESSEEKNLRRLLEMIDASFEFCFRAQQAFKHEVQQNIVDFAKQYGQETFHFGHSPLRPEISLPLPDNFNVSSQLSPPLHHAANCFTSFANQNGETQYKASSHSLPSEMAGPRTISRTRGVVKQPNATVEPSMPVDVFRTEWSPVYEPGAEPGLDERMEDTRSDATGLTAKQSDRSGGGGRMSAKFSATGLYVVCRGVCAPVENLNQLPPWIRLSEKALHSDPTRVPSLHEHWINAIQAEDVDLGSVVEACKKANFLATLTKSYLQIEKRSFTANRNGLRRSMDASRRICKMIRRFFKKTIWEIFPLHPSGRLRTAWDSVSFLVVFYDMILLPMIAFDFGAGATHVKETLDLFAAVFWTLDVVMSFNSGYLDGMVVIRQYRRIAQTYARSWMLLDLTIIANDWLSMFASSALESAGFPARYLKLVKSIMRCIRLIRLWKITTNFSNALKLLKSQLLLTGLKIATHTMIVFMICHYAACGFYGVHAISGPRTNWVEDFGFADATTPFKYFTSLHWALTQLLPASMQVYPVNMPERIYNIGFICVTMVLAAFYTSSIIVSMNHLRAIKGAAIERDNQLRTFFKQHALSDELAGAIWGFIAKRSRSVPPRMKPSDVIALKGMPEHILERVYEESFLRHLQVHPLFDFYSKVEPMCVAKICRTGLEQRILLSEEMMWHDLVVTRMLLVRHGSLRYPFDAMDPEREIIVQPGEWCCEEALWGRKPSISAPFHAGLAGCELLMVIPDAFQQISKASAKDRNSFVFLARYGEEFIRRFVDASHDSECSDILFNSLENVVRLLKCVLTSMQSRTSIASEDSDDVKGSASTDSEKQNFKTFHDRVSQFSVSAQLSIVSKNPNG